MAEHELRRYNSIVEQHGDQLEEIIEALGPHPAPPWDPKLDPITLKVRKQQWVVLGVNMWIFSAKIAIVT